MRHFVLVMGVGVALLLSACGSTVRLDNAPVEDRSVSAGGTVGQQAGGNSATVSSVGNGAVAQVDLTPRTADAVAQGPARVIYFDYDSYAIRAEYQSVLDSNARYLMADASRKVRLEGHTDFRGGREYNLSLGQKRAETVQRALTLLGVRDNQIEAISFGKEKPAVDGESEEAMAKNRRVEISYQ